ncbi:MAG: anion permease, partial [marine benthic group bacterium]|nr:anion permease [Gemmatimonadota bacterium]
LTELTSNTATAATFLPVLGAVALAIGQDPLVLAVPAALAASGAFMLPVATPPNAIVYGSGAVEMTDMVRAGVWINLLFTLLITAASRVFVPVVFGL